MLGSLLILISPVKCLRLTLYLTFTNKSIGDLLAQEAERIEHPLDYLSRSLWSIRWIISFESHFIVSIFTTQKPSIVCYLTAIIWSWSLILSIICYLGQLCQDVLLGWLSQLSEFNISVLLSCDFDNSSTHRGSRARIVWYALDGTDVFCFSSSSSLIQIRSWVWSSVYRANLCPADGSSQALCARKFQAYYQSSQ